MTKARDRERVMVKSWREENTIIDHSKVLSCSRSVAMMARTCPAITPIVHIVVFQSILITLALTGISSTAARI